MLNWAGTQCPTSGSSGEFNPWLISGNYTDPVSRTLGPSYKPNFCLITVVVVGFNSLWIKYDPVYDMNPSHFSTDVHHTEALAFSQSVWWKGGSGWNTKPLSFHKRLRREELEGWCERIGLIAELEGVLVRQVEKWKKHRCHSDEHLLVLLLFKRREDKANSHRMSWLLKICPRLCFSGELMIFI